MQSFFFLFFDDAEEKKAAEILGFVQEVLIEVI